MFKVMAFAMWMSLDIVIFLAFASCCLMRYGATMFLGGGGKYGSGGVEEVKTLFLYFSGIRHIIRLDGSSLFVCVV